VAFDRPGEQVTSPWAARVRLLLFLLGVLLLVYLVHRADPARVLATARAGLVYLPLLALCNGAFFVFEAYGQRSLLGEAGARIPQLVFVRTTLAAYVAGTLLPIGRAGAEVARIATYSPYVGGARAAAASAAFQVPALWGTAIFGTLCAMAAAAQLGPGSQLTWILLAHALGSLGLGVLLYLVLRRAALGHQVSRFFPSLAERAASFDAAAIVPTRLYWGAVGWCLLARAVEIAQFALALAAVGLIPTPTRATLAAGVQIVGATVGEAIPGQLGAVEAAFAYFAPALGLGEQAAHAVTMPLLVRVAQFGLAALALLASSPWLPRLGPKTPLTSE